ncbi:MAG: LPS assembly lipoprotein LptE [Rubricoccaceae bacterium]|nr:LPS assembly lipoprotein LptE [Rubricoccaceae bacterium]
MNTIAVPLVEIRTSGSISDLDQTLTEALVERFVDRTRLTLEPSEDAADAVLTTSVDRYSLTPVAVTGEERASLNRVTIVVSVRYLDRVEENERLSRTFTASADYDPVEGPAGESEAVLRAVDQLANDIFTAATSDW